MTDTEHKPDTAQAVIEAARAVLAHVTTAILVDRKTDAKWLEVGVFIGGGLITNTFKEGDDEPPDTLLGTLAGLVAAMDAHDEMSTTVDSERKD